MTEIEHQQGSGAESLEAEVANLGEKYKGKSPVEIARMHAELEKAYSRQGNELGEYRKLATTLLEVQPDRGQKPKEERPEVTTDALLANPGETLDSAIESHPAVKRAKETTEELERQLHQQKFVERHPSFKDDVADPAFAEWVKKSEVRKRLAVQADSYNFDAAEELWSMWEDRKADRKEIEAARKAQKDESRRTAEKAGILEGASGADGTVEVTLDRAEIRELHRRALLGDRQALAKWNNPGFQAMRKKAYGDQRAK